MNQPRQLKFLGAICILLLGGILTAGLWPFHAPKNQVWWPAGVNGLRFGKHGSIVSSGELAGATSTGDDPFSIELWIDPAPAANSGTILAFHSRESGRRFSIYQYYTGLDLQSEQTQWNSGAPPTRFYIHGIFHPGTPTFVTVTSTNGNTAVYVEGLLAKSSKSFPVSGRDMAGQIVVSDSPRSRDSWSGTLRGLALYREALPPQQVLQHYAEWTKNGRPALHEHDRAVGLYLFDEHGGNLIHNQIAQGTDLYIPERYRVVDEYLFEPLWKEYETSWGYYQDVLVNIGGFIPFGFMFLFYLSVAAKWKKPALITILLGLAVSLTIEFTQGWLPTRDSGMTDVITNTSGTALGVLLYRWAARRQFFLKLWAAVCARLEVNP